MDITREMAGFIFDGYSKKIAEATKHIILLSGPTHPFLPAQELINDLLAEITRCAIEYGKLYVAMDGCCTGLSYLFDAADRVLETWDGENTSGYHHEFCGDHYRFWCSRIGWEVTIPSHIS